MTRRTRLPLWLAGLLLLASAACDSPFFGDDDSFQRDLLAEKRAVWAAEGGNSYDYTLELQCYCAPAAQLEESVRVSVRNGVVVSRTYTTTTPVAASAAVFDTYDTVPELFAVVEAAIRGDANVLQVGYHDEYGFPEVVNIDPSGSVNDDQRLFIVSDFTLVP
jgi:uncharacterized protein DUF6174